jgi:conjugative relaxase-like TrwC/TraI family protein
MAWFRPMGVDEVAYHQATVLGRDDDHPGLALDYYGSRGETPLRWGGTGAGWLELSGEVTAEGYERAFGPGGFRDPGTGGRLVTTRRPGFELVIGAHKSVAVLGVIGQAEVMHSILDAEIDATMAWLDRWFQESGGRRGRGQVRAETSGLVYAQTRHGTSRAGDPAAHDHVLVANVTEMLDGKGGFKALDSAALRDTTEAATMVGRMASAARALEAGFAIEPDPGPSGNLRHWRIVGMPDEVCQAFSKRSDEISEYLAESGHSSYRARGIAARNSRSVKRHTGVDQLLPGWQAELEAIGWPIERLVAYLDMSRHQTAQLNPRLTDLEIGQLAAQVLDVDGSLLVNHKVFSRTNLIAELAPRLYGHDPGELNHVVDRILAAVDVVPLLGVAGAREQAYTTAQVLAAEHSIAHSVAALAGQPGPRIPYMDLHQAITAKDQMLGLPMSMGQRAAVQAICGSGRSVEVIVGVAGSGKTTALDVASGALTAAGYRVLGASTSGQAATNLGAETGIEARTLASLLWRLERDQETLDSKTVVIVDEAGMTNDRDLGRLALGVQRAGAKLILVGDHRQLDAIGPGGALHALLERQPELVTELDENVRQRDPAERVALADLRDGSVPDAVAWYAVHDRIHTTPSRTDTLVAMADNWAADIDHGHSTALLAWRRDDVADLNRLARDRYDQAGHLTGPDLVAPGGRAYAAGDRVVSLAPIPTARIVTSQQLTITHVDPDKRTLVVRTGDGRDITLAGRNIDQQHLDHGYALTVHRAQGATYDTAHVLAGGGGRELGYVAMSRARDHTTIHATADDVGQAVDDLQGDWGVPHHQRWVTDIPDVAVGLEPEPPPQDEVARMQERLDRLFRTPADMQPTAGQHAPQPLRFPGRPVDAVRRAEPNTVAAVDDPWILDRQLQAEREEHAAIAIGRPRDFSAQLDRAGDVASRAAKEHQWATQAMDSAEERRARLGPLSHLRRSGRDDIAAADNALARAHQRLDYATLALHKAQTGLQACEAAVAERTAWDRTDHWRLDRIAEIDHTLAHHWAEVTLAAVRGGDPLGFGIDRLRAARTTYHADLTAIVNSLPPDRRDQLDLANADLHSRQRELGCAQHQLVEAEEALDSAAQRHWGRRDKPAIERATAQLQTAEASFDVAGHALTQAEQQVIQERRSDAAWTAAMDATSEQRRQLEARIHDAAAALDGTRIQRIADAALDPTNQLWETLGPPPPSRGGTAAWCGIAEQLETINDHHAAIADRQVPAAFYTSQERQVAALLAYAADIIDTANRLDPRPTLHPLQEQALWQRALESAAQHLSAQRPPPAIDDDRSLGL